MSIISEIKSPITGIGLGTHQYHPESKYTFGGYTILVALTETGIIGFIGFIGMFYFLFYDSYKLKLNISIDKNLKKQAVELFDQFGLDFSTAISLFLSQAVREQKIPFEIRMNVPNATTIAALNEYDEMKKDKKKYKRYDSFEDVLKEK